MQQQKPWILVLLPLLTIFCIVIIVGRYVYTEKSDSEKIGPPVYPARSFSSDTVQKAASSTTAFSFDATLDPEAELTACADALKKDTEAKKTDYVKGSILVGFKSDISFDAARSILASYKLTPETSQDTAAAYVSHNVLTVKVNSGDEFTKICILKNNSGVRYAGINPSFSLHE